MIFGSKDTLPKIQLIIIVIVIGVFFTLGAALSAAYGGIISLVNTGLINKHTNKQKQALTMSAASSVSMMNASVVTRLITVVVLVLTGLVSLKLDAAALISGLVFGLLGFLIDTFLINRTK